MGAGKLAVVLMLVLAVVMVKGGDAASSPSTANDGKDYMDCLLNTCPSVYCPWPIPDSACKVICAAKCAIPSQVDSFCNAGCISTNCNTLFSNSNSNYGEVAVKACVRGCADVCSSSSSTTPLTKLDLGRNQLV